jgi:hypothetical protein
MNDTRLIDEPGVMQDQRRTERLWAKGRFQDFAVKLIAVEKLTLNLENRRFRADRRPVESALERTIPQPGDEDVVIALLLDRECRVEAGRFISTPSKDTTALIKDWEEREQERPLWIEPNGLVRNGNRRLAMMKRRLAAGGGERFAHVEVIVLDPAEFDESTLFAMEAREQLTEGLKVNYTDINLLLTLQEAAERNDVDWHDPRSIESVAEKIAHLANNNPGYARLQLDAVKYMADYLRHIDRADEYDRLRGRVEIFRDIGRNMRLVADSDPELSVDMLEVCFAAVTSGATYQHVRDVRAIVRNEYERFLELVAEIRDVRENAPTEPDADEQPEADEDDEDDGASSADELAVPGYPRQAVRRAIDLAAQMSRARRSATPDHDLRLAADHLDRVPASMLPELLEGPGRERVQSARDDILAWAEEVRITEESEPGT